MSQFATMRCQEKVLEIMPIADTMPKCTTVLSAANLDVSYDAPLALKLWVAAGSLRADVLASVAVATAPVWAVYEIFSCVEFEMNRVVFHREFSFRVVILDEGLQPDGERINTRRGCGLLCVRDRTGAGPAANHNEDRASVHDNLACAA